MWQDVNISPVSPFSKIYMTNAIKSEYLAFLSKQKGCYFGCETIYPILCAEMLLYSASY